MSQVVDDVFKPKTTRRLLLLPAVLLLVLMAMPWLLEYVEDHVLSPHLHYFGEAVDSIITALLGLWVLVMIQREQKTTRHHLAQLEHLSLTDPLTGLGNRRAFERDLELAVHRAQRTQAPLALLYLDVDGLKRINDRHGHAVGDETLRALGAVLRSSSRIGTDAAYRVGGDEFVMVLTASGAGVESIAERLVGAFKARSPRGSHVSTGVVVWNGEARVQELINEADTRMYRHKHPGVRTVPA